MNIEYLTGRAWLSIPDFKQNLLDELDLLGFSKKNIQLYDDFVYVKNFKPTAEKARNNLPPQASTANLLPAVYWHKTELYKPFIARFESITEAASILRSIQRNWALYPQTHFRRAELIEQKLPYVNKKVKIFPYSVPLSPMGIWTLLDEHTLLASAECSSPFPCGEIEFEQDRINPPSRAYLKMYEGLTWIDYLTRKANKQEKSLLPKAGSRCLDAGACPGGWSWVLDQLGAHITAIDRSELDPRLMARPNITFIKHDAFTLKPSDLGPQDWVFSDVICYPPRLLQWVHEWIESGLCKNFMCTIKMQGKADHQTTRLFAQIPNAHIIHLGANKHELTFILT